MDKQSEKFFDNLVLSLKPGEILAFPKTSWPIFRWEWNGCIPDWHWKWVMEDGLTLEWEFYAFKPHWKWKVKFDDWTEFEWEWIDGKLEIDMPHMTFWVVVWDLEFLVIQKNEDWTFDKYEWPIV